MTLPELLTHVRELLSNARPDKWHLSEARDDSEYISIRNEFDSEICWVTHEGPTEATAALIAASPALLSKLCRIVELQDAALKQYANKELYEYGEFSDFSGSYGWTLAQGVQITVQAILEEV